MQYRLVIRDRATEAVEFDKWYPTEALRTAAFNGMTISPDKQYLIEEKPVPPYDPNEPPTGEWRVV